jgi:hypothetical protein
MIGRKSIFTAVGISNITYVKINTSIKDEKKNQFKKCSNIIITIPDIIHRSAFYKKKKKRHNVSESEFCFFLLVFLLSWTQ